MPLRYVFPHILTVGFLFLLVTASSHSPPRRHSLISLSSFSLPLSLFSSLALIPLTHITHRTSHITHHTPHTTHHTPRTHTHTLTHSLMPHTLTHSHATHHTLHITQSHSHSHSHPTSHITHHTPHTTHHTLTHHNTSHITRHITNHTSHTHTHILHPTSFLHILALLCSSAVGVAKVGCASFPMDLRYIFTHSGSPMWLCGRRRKSRVRLFSYGFPMYVHTFWLSYVALR